MPDATREIPNVTDRRLACFKYVKLFSNLSWDASFCGNGGKPASRRAFQGATTVAARG